MPRNARVRLHRGQAWGRRDNSPASCCPMFVRVLHRNLCASQQQVFEMLKRDGQSSDDGRQIQSFAPVKRWSWDSDGHGGKSGWNEGQNCRDNEDVNQCDLEKEEPAETHQLVIAKSGQGPSDPHENRKGRWRLLRRRLRCLSGRRSIRVNHREFPGNASRQKIKSR